MLQNLTIPEPIRSLLSESMRNSNNYAKGWTEMQANGLVENTEEGIKRVLKSPTATEGYALIGKI